MKKENELSSVLSHEIDKVYLLEQGLSHETQLELYRNHYEVFLEVAPNLKKICDDVVSCIIETENRECLPFIMRQCMSKGNQILFVETWPEDVKPYLDTLEKLQIKSHRYFFSKEAEECYLALQEEYPELPNIPLKHQHYRENEAFF